jgi:hypothetical protein
MNISRAFTTDQVSNGTSFVSNDTTAMLHSDHTCLMAVSIGNDVLGRFAI